MNGRKAAVHTEEQAPQTGFCSGHPELIRSVAELCADLRWLARIGKWMLMVMGSLSVLCLPMLVSLLVEIASIERQIAVQESKITVQESRITKMTQQFEYLTRREGKLNGF